MAITAQASFTLLRFEWTPPDRLDVAGTWVGVENGDLSNATLILHGPRSVHRLEPVQGVSGHMRNWSAVFSWPGDPESVERAELVLGSTLVVELPSSDSKQARRRFGRTRLAVRELEQQGAAASGPEVDGDVLAVHAAMVAAQEEAAEARDELARLQAEVERARELAKRERARRESDAARLHEAMGTLRGLAEDSLQKEREATRRVSSQLDEVEASISGAQAEAAQLREQAQAAVAGRDEAAEQVRLQHSEIERLRAKLDQLTRDARELSERARVELEAARTQLREQEQASATSTAELTELRAAYDGARQEAARAGARLAGVEAELVAARQAQEEAERLRTEVADAQLGFEAATAEAERLRSKLTALREVFEQGV